MFTKDDLKEVLEERKEVVANTTYGRPSFIKPQKIDARAAFERKQITQKMLQEYQLAINSTNTVDVAGDLKELYDEFEKIAKMIMTAETTLIIQGE